MPASRSRQDTTPGASNVAGMSTRSQIVQHRQLNQVIEHRCSTNTNVPPPWHMKLVITRWKLEPL